MHRGTYQHFQKITAGQKPKRGFYRVYHYWNELDTRTYLLTARRSGGIQT